MKMKITEANRNDGKAGFTLVELLVAMAISGILISAIYSAYVFQQKSYVVQEQVAETQENLRASMIRLLSDIRQAGCDPTQTAGAGILEATATRFRFTADIGGGAVNLDEADGDTFDANENIAFGISRLALEVPAGGIIGDANNNGIADGGGVDWSIPGQLGRDSGDGVMQPAAELIDAVEFNYILADGTSTTAPVFLNDIRAVQISLLARGARPDPDANFFDSSTFTTASGRVWIPGDTNGDGVRDVPDNFRRRFVIVTIKLRNMGI